MVEGYMIYYKGWLWMLRGCFNIDGGFLAFPRYSSVEEDVVLKEPNDSFSKALEIAPETIKFVPCVGQEAPVLGRNTGSLLNPLDLRNIRNDRMGKTALELVEILRGYIGSNSVGITGGLLAGRSKTKDIDIVIYGENESRRAYQILSKKKILEKYTSEDVIRLLENRGEIIYNSRIVDRETKKVLQGKFGGIDVYIRLVPCKPNEIKNCEYTVVKKGTFSSHVLITDDTDSMIYPCRYKAIDLEKRIKNEFYITSDRGRYCELLRKGEKAFVRGDLEIIVKDDMIAKQIYLWKKDHYLIPDY
jgi:predicted nucleotidyltransferase